MHDTAMVKTRSVMPVWQRTRPNRMAGRVGKGMKILIALLAVLALFTWDIPVGYYKFRRACESEGGLRVVGEIAPAKSLRLDRNNFGPPNAEGMLRKYPTLEWVEAKKLNSSEAPYLRFTRTPAGLIVIDANPSSDVADYVLAYRQTSLAIRTDKGVYELRTSEGIPVATWSRFHFRWTDPARTPLGAINYSDCFGGGLAYEHLIALIARYQVRPGRQDARGHFA